jgi:hypothetical protein
LHSQNIRCSKYDYDVETSIKYQNPDGVKIAVGNIYNNCKDEEQRFLYSFVEDYPTVDVMLLIEGAFEFLVEPNKFHEPIPPESDDGTNEMIDTFIEEQRERGSRGIRVYRETVIGNEFQKRQRYVELAQVFKCNVLMIVDSDEYIHEDSRIQVSKNWNNFRRRLKGAFDHDHNVYDISIVRTEFGGRQSHKRIWIRPEQMTYWKGSHYKFVRIGDPDINNSNWANQYGTQPTWYLFEDVSLKHDHNLRTDEHFYFRNLYQNYLVKYEHLLERGFSLHDADMIAKATMQAMSYKDICTCKRCVIKNNIDPRVLFDARPKVMRKEYDPFADIKEMIKQDPEYAKTLKRNFE